MPKSGHQVRKHRGWVVTGAILGTLILGGMLARWSSVVFALALITTGVVALYVIIARPLPQVGLRSKRSGFAAFGLAALLATGGGATVAASTSEEPPTAAHFVEDSDTAPFPTRQPTALPSASPKPTPTTFETLVERITVPFERATIEDSGADQGVTTLVTAGRDGVTAVTYRVIFVNGVESTREIISEVVEVAPVSEVTSIGTRVPLPPPVPLTEQASSGCHPSYAGVCVPFASDVDCAGGSGDGPAYVSGPLQVVGHDEYGLDRDGDGIACD